MSWIALLLIGLATLVYGLVVVVLRTSDEQYLRAIGVASVGMGLFGVMITLTAFKRCERWAFFSLWYYPAFWLAHLVGNLPPAGITSIRSSSSDCRSWDCCSRSANSSRDRSTARKKER